MSVSADILNERDYQNPISVEENEWERGLVHLTLTLMFNVASAANSV